jgi:hypothetical protein
MDTFKTALLSVAAIFAVAATSGADAGGHHHYRSRVGVGVFVGAPFYPYYYPRYYYPPAYYPGPYAYYPPAAVVPAPAGPPAYIEQTPPAATAPSASASAGPAASWYYCRDSQAYYPYVQQCASPWQPVAPQSDPGQSGAPGPQSGLNTPNPPYEPQAAPMESVHTDARPRT